MTQKDNTHQKTSDWFLRDLSPEKLEEYLLSRKRFDDEWQKREENKKNFQKTCFEIFQMKNPDEIIKKALEGVPMILSDADMKIVQKYTAEWLQKDGNISLAEFDQAKNALTNQKNVGIFVSIMNVISEAKNSNLSCNFQNMTTNTKIDTNGNNENFPTWLDEDASRDPNELPEWLQPGPGYVPPTKESEEEFQKYMEARRRVVLHIYKYNGIKSVVDFLGAEGINEDFEDFRFFEQIARNDLKIIYQFAEKYLAMSAQKLEGKVKIQNEIERREYFESTKNIFSSAMAQNLLYFTRKEIDDIALYL